MLAEVKVTSVWLLLLPFESLALFVSRITITCGCALLLLDTCDTHASA